MLSDLICGQGWAMDVAFPSPDLGLAAWGTRVQVTQGRAAFRPSPSIRDCLGGAEHSGVYYVVRRQLGCYFCTVW
jgi:hypothetical protein